MSQKYVEIWEASKSSRNVLNIGICWQLKVYTWIFLIGFGYLGVLNTNEEITPDLETSICGNRIYVKTLDLYTDFKNIASQLDEIISYIKIH